jgi:hypothetical protein
LGNSLSINHQGSGRFPSGRASHHKDLVTGKTSSIEGTTTNLANALPITQSVAG